MTAKPEGTSAFRTSDGLTLAQHRLRVALLEGLEPAIAAQHAGLSARQARRVMAMPLFQQLRERDQQRQLEAGICTRDDLMRELWKIGGSDLRKLMSDTGTLLDPSDWPDDIAGAVESVDVAETFEGTGKNRVWTGQIVKLRLHSKLGAISQLARMIGADTPPKTPLGPDGKPMREARRILVVPAKRTEEDMASHGASFQVLEAQRVVPEADDEPVAVATPKAALAKLRRLAKGGLT